MIALVAEKMFYRTQQVGAEASALRIRCADPSPRQQSREELLRQFARRILLAPLATQETEHRLVIRLAQFTQSPTRLDAFSTRTQGERPARGRKAKKMRGVAQRLFHAFQ